MFIFKIVSNQRHLTRWQDVQKNPVNVQTSLNKQHTNLYVNITQQRKCTTINTNYGHVHSYISEQMTQRCVLEICLETNKQTNNISLGAYRSLLTKPTLVLKSTHVYCKTQAEDLKILTFYR